MNWATTERLRYLDEEMSRLRALNDELAAAATKFREGMDEETARLCAINDELLAMLRFAAAIIGHPDDEGSKLIAATIAKAGGCTYPNCDCAVSFPEGYHPSEATECPHSVGTIGLPPPSHLPRTE